MLIEASNIVLIVEDDADTRANLCDILEMDGVEVHSAGSFAEAMANDYGDRVRAIVLDRRLPDGDAEDRLPQLRAAFSNAAIIVVTGYPGLDDAIACLKQGADDYLLKPINADALRSSLARFRELHKTKDELHEREARLEAILNAAVDSIITIDRSGIIQTVNAAASNMFGYAEDEMLGRNVVMLMPSSYRAEHDQSVANYLKTGIAKIIGIGREFVAQRKDGTSFPVHVSVSEIDHLQLFTGIVQDLSDRKELERHLAESRIEERRRMSQELHDGLGGLMTGIGMLAKALQVEMERDKSPQANQLADLVHHIRDAHEQLRQIARGLLPVEVVPEGLRGALGELAERTNRQGILTCQFDYEGDVTVNSPTHATHLYRLAQEAVSNAVRHGKPSRIAIEMKGDGRSVTLAVRDDGAGIQQSSDGGRGMGMRTMRYRAEDIGAIFAVGPGEAGGTVVRCTYPKEVSA